MLVLFRYLDHIIQILFVIILFSWSMCFLFFILFFNSVDGVHVNLLFFIFYFVHSILANLNDLGLLIM